MRGVRALSVQAKGAPRNQCNLEESVESRSAATFLSAGIHWEGDKDLVIYQDDLEGKEVLTIPSLLLIPWGFGL